MVTPERMSSAGFVACILQCCSPPHTIEYSKVARLLPDARRMLRHLAGLMGPIFVKEVTEIARRRRFYLSRTLYGLALVIILVLVWQEQRWHVRNSVSLNAAAYLAEELFTATSIVQFGGVFLFVPLFLCGTIAGEREERTLEVLFSTHLSDRDIVLGKLGSRLAAMACLIFCGLPVLSLLMTQGGIAPESLWRVLTATFLGILFTAAHAMYFSATTGSTIEALVRTYWWLAVWLIGVPVLGMMAFELMWGPWRTPPVYLFGPLLFVNPLGPMIVAVDGSSYNLMAQLPRGLVLPGSLRGADRVVAVSAVAGDAAPASDADARAAMAQGLARAALALALRESARSCSLAAGPMLNCSRGTAW